MAAGDPGGNFSGTGGYSSGSTPQGMAGGYGNPSSPTGGTGGQTANAIASGNTGGNFAGAKGVNNANAGVSSGSIGGISKNATGTTAVAAKPKTYAPTLVPMKPKTYTQTYGLDLTSEIPSPNIEDDDLRQTWGPRAPTPAGGTDIPKNNQGLPSGHIGMNRSTQGSSGGGFSGPVGGYGYANGGQIPDGQVARVGERGEEFVLGPGTVLNRKMVARLANQMFGTTLK